MQTSYFLMILVFTITTLGVIIQLPIASSDDFGGITQLHAPRPDLTKISLSLNDTFQQTSQNSTNDLHFRFFDANNNSTINNVTFFINATKDGKVLMHDLFYTSTGSMTLKFSPGSDIKKWVMDGTNEPTLGGWMSKNDTLHIQGPAFTEGTYHIHVGVLSLFYVNELVDQSNPPTFDSWWLVNEKGNISKYDNSIIGTSLQLGNNTVANRIQSPLQQFKSGVVENGGFITCKPGFYFVLKAYDREPLCLKAGTISKLASRGFLFATSTSNDNHATVIISRGSENQASPNTYSPNIITVVLGVNNTVRWVSQSDTANTIVPDMPLVQNGISFGSDGVIKPGELYQFTFTEPGTFTYHTDPHPWMKGTVIVLSSTNTDSHTSGEENTALHASFEPCDTPFQTSNDRIAVLYMPLNSVGKLCVRYSNYNNSPERFSGGINIFDPNNSYQSVPDITTWSDLGNTTIIQKNDSFTTVYWIKTGNHTGLYGLNLYCGGMPFAVGYGDSNLTAVDFPFLGKSFLCPAIPYDSKIDSMSGIGVKYIPSPER